ncbi:SIR2 family protein [Brevibacterium sp. CFH 10365]|uniref:SIR2 family protein n=1 Tax=Brevibacterium sp. CFH 10365 TaxID=2585207 RepID=UPI0012664A59|nr:SIR2 family protein [Brevibacterium sp. CFH 10365]
MLETSVESVGSATGPERVAVLLGAGASADAGLKLTGDLAKAIVEEANAPRRLLASDRDWIQALNAVYAGMVNYQTIHGDNPLTSVNIEMLISAIRLLRERDSLEIAPFVGSWSAGISDFTSTHLPLKTTDRLVASLGKSLGDASSRVGEQLNLSRILIDTIQSATHPDLKKPLEDAEHFVLTTLLKLLGNHGDVEYLQPLINLAISQRGGIDVLTLNYDLTVEAAASGQVDLVRGVESWSPGHAMEIPQKDRTLNLIKLHGSLDWRLRGFGVTNDPRLTGRGIRVLSEAEMNAPEFQDSEPWIVVGTRDKLGTDGPTLELNFAARSALRRADRLVIVGYSFHDNHVNNMIRDWLSSDEQRNISVVDKYFPSYRYRYENPEEDSFRNALLREYSVTVDYDGNPLTPKMHVFQGTAAEVLGEAISSPVEGRGELVEINAHRSGTSFQLDFHCGNTSMTDVHIWTSPSESREGESRAENVSLHWQYPPREDDPTFSYRPVLDVTEMPAGETVTAYMSPGARGVFDVVIHGSSIYGEQKTTIQMKATDEGIEVIT